MKKNQKNKSLLTKFRFPRGIIEKLDDQILLLALGLSAMITVITMENPQPPTWVPQTFVSIFLIATIYSCFKEALHKNKPTC